jgi:hypothetical protein
MSRCNQPSHRATFGLEPEVQPGSCWRHRSHRSDKHVIVAFASCVRTTNVSRLPGRRLVRGDGARHLFADGDRLFIALVAATMAAMQPTLMPAVPAMDPPAPPTTDKPMPTEQTPPAGITVSAPPTASIATRFLDKIVLAGNSGRIGDTGGLACDAAESEGANRDDCCCDD